MGSVLHDIYFEHVMLQGFRLRFLGAHLERLLRLADDATLRLELAAFPLAPGADGGIAAEHRAGAARHLSVRFPDSVGCLNGPKDLVIITYLTLE